MQPNKTHIPQLLTPNSTICQIVCHHHILFQTATRIIITYLMVPEITIPMLDHSYQRNLQMVPTHLVPRYLWTVILRLSYYQQQLQKMIPQIMKDRLDGVDIGEGQQEKDLLRLGSVHLHQ